MWAMMLISYTIISLIDINSFSKSNEKGKLPLYITLMAISGVISIANNYLPNMPSPAHLFKNIVQAIIGG